ncbi:MAG: hypothetical protein AMJ69_08425 [Gammaproteobacteria bacterium SG8_47]|nr:MAG: hypothetical protein AMJ69_08425 [Gammaproteobacteria bacterium SG8_47]
MSAIIDRRLNGKNKSAVNRQRFLRRYRQQIKDAVTDAVNGRSITEVDKGERINIPTKDVGEPIFHHGKGGRRESVHPGNDEFVAGDRVQRPPGGGAGKGGEASKDGEGEDDFVFQISREEFLEFFFDDLALPDLVKTQLARITEHKMVRAGYSSDGVPTNINVVRSLRGALARRIALRSPLERRLAEIEQAIDAPESGDAHDAKRADDVCALREEARKLRQRIAAVPWIDTFDLRYNNRIKQPKPTTQAVMFCLMDVSGSMDESRKDIAKRFFILLYLFLKRNYERIDVVFIRHHTIAKEVDENDFFHSRETGGTVVSSALELMYEIIRERYPTNQWNIYAAQASDGDNWDDDSPRCRELLANAIMPCLQYFAYVEIAANTHQSLWREYERVQSLYENFSMETIASAQDIYPVFRELFKKQAA